MLNKIIPIAVVFVFCSFVQAQSMSIYPKKGGKIKITNGIVLKNGSIVLSDSSIIKKVIPLKYINKIKYAQKSYRPIGNIFWFSGQWILSCSLLPAVIGNPTLFYEYGGLGGILMAAGAILNNIGSKFGRNVISYRFKGLNYVNRELIVESVLADMEHTIHKTPSGKFYHKPHGKKLNLPKVNWLLSFSAKSEPRGIEAWIEKHKLREKRFFQIAIPKK